MRYFFGINYNLKAPDYGKPSSVYRVYQDSEGFHTEKWNGKQWEDFPAFRTVVGLGGDYNFGETDEERALECVKNSTKH